MMTKVNKIISVLTVIMMILAIVSNVCFALSPSEIKPNDANTGDIQDIGETIIGFLKVAGILIAVGVVVVLGIKYMMGSASEKAEYKKTMIPYIIGAILVAAAPQIAGIIYDFGDKIQ